MRLVTFGDYTFPDTQTELNDNFGEVLIRSQRLAGLDGGYDPDGDAPAPKEVGNVRTALWLFGDTEAALRQARAAIYSMLEYGRQRLYLDPKDGTGELRYTLAKINNISSSESVAQMPHKRLRVSVNWQATEPYWIGEDGEIPTYGGNFTYGGGALYGGTSTTTALNGTSTEIVVSNAGNAHTYPRLTLRVDAGQTITDPVIKRMVGGVVIDQVAYSGTLTAGDVLVIDCRALSVKLNGTAAYEDLTWTRGYWLKLLPGSNTLRVEADNASDSASLNVYFLRRYH